MGLLDSIKKIYFDNPNENSREYTVPNTAPYDEYDYDMNDVNKWGFTMNDTKGLDFATSETVNPIVQDVRNMGPAGVEGSLPLWSPDGSNCVRSTVGLTMKGTPYEDVPHIKGLVKKAMYYGDGFVPDDADYEWQPSDIEVWNGHVVMRTENGGRIQNGVSANGIHESDDKNQLYDLGEKPNYVVRLGGYKPDSDPSWRDDKIKELYGTKHDLEGMRFKPIQGNPQESAYGNTYADQVKERLQRLHNDKLNYYRYDDYVHPNSRPTFLNRLNKARSNEEKLKMLFDAYKNYREDKDFYGQFY